MPRLQAETQLLAIEAASVPHMKESVRSRIMGRWSRRLRNERRKTASEALATLPIPIVYEPVKGGEAP